MEIPITLTNQRVLVEVPELKEERLSSGVYAPKTRSREKVWISKVISHALDCEYVKEGMVVHYSPKLQERLGDSQHFSDNQMIIRESDILAYEL